MEGYSKFIQGKTIDLCIFDLDTDLYHLARDLGCDIEDGPLLSDDPYHSYFAAYDTVSEWKSLNYYAFVIADKSGNTLGFCYLHIENRISGSACFLIALKKDSRRKGVGEEVIKLMLDYGFGELNLYNIWCWVHSANTAAVNCYKKCGFTLTGVLKDTAILHGKRYSWLLYQFLRKDWVKSK